MGRIKELRERKAALVKEADALLGKQASADGLSEAEDGRYKEIEASLDQVNAAIAREERLMDERRSMEAVADINVDTEAEAAAKVPAAAKKAEPFKSFGEELQAVARAEIAGDKIGRSDRRLSGLYIPGGIEAAAGGSEAVPSEGGFLVQTDFADALLESMFAQGEVLSRVFQVPISARSNGLKMPMVDETSRADGSRWGGVQAYWADEAAAVTATKPKFREIEMRLKKLFGLAYATEELIEDTAALETIYTAAFTEELTFKAEDAIVNGDGSGKPLGLINSGALVSVAKEGSQAATTIVTNNVLKMFSRLPPRSMTRAVWLVNQDTLPQLWALTLGSGAAVVLLYRPPGVDGPNVGPAGSLIGRPVIPVEYCATLGTKGDILLVDLGEYMMIEKGGIKQASSMHVRFIYDEMTFRLTWRIDGQPMRRLAVTPKNGTATLSPYIALDERA